MRVRADEACKAYWNYGIVNIAEGEIVEGGLAQYLAETGAPVTVLEDEPTAGADRPPSLGVPDGTIDEIMEWVGDDPAKALRALEAETAGKARTTLVGKLEKILEAATAGAGENPPVQPNPDTASAGPDSGTQHDDNPPAGD